MQLHMRAARGGRLEGTSSFYASWILHHRFSVSQYNQSHGSTLHVFSNPVLLGPQPRSYLSNPARLSLTSQIRSPPPTFPNPALLVRTLSTTGEIQRWQSGGIRKMALRASASRDLSHFRKGDSPPMPRFRKITLATFPSPTALFTHFLALRYGTTLFHTACSTGISRSFSSLRHTQSISSVRCCKDWKTDLKTERVIERLEKRDDSTILLLI